MKFGRPRLENKQKEHWNAATRVDLLLQMYSLHGGGEGISGALLVLSIKGSKCQSKTVTRSTDRKIGVFYHLTRAAASGPHFTVKRCCPRRLYWNFVVDSKLSIVSSSTSKAFMKSAEPDWTCPTKPFIFRNGLLIWALPVHELENLHWESRKWET